MTCSTEAALLYEIKVLRDALTSTLHDREFWYDRGVGGKSTIEAIKSALDNTSNPNHREYYDEFGVDDSCVSSTSNTINTVKLVEDNLKLIKAIESIQRESFKGCTEGCLVCGEINSICGTVI